MLGRSQAYVLLIKSTLISANGLGAVKDVVESFFWGGFCWVFGGLCGVGRSGMAVKFGEGRELG